MTEDSLRQPSHEAWHSRLELWLLGGVFLAGHLLAGLLFLVFGEIAEEIAGGDVNWFDAQVLFAFRDAADPANTLGPQWLEEAARDLIALGSTAVLSVVITLAAVAYLRLIRRGKGGAPCPHCGGWWTSAQHHHEGSLRPARAPISSLKPQRA